MSRWAPGLVLGALSCVTGLLAGLEPAFAISAAFALAFALVAFADLTIGLAAYILFVFMEPGSLGKVLIAATVVLTLAWVVRVTSLDQARTETFFAQHRGASYLLLLFLGWAAISTTWATSSGDAFSELWTYVINVAVFLIAYSVVQTRKQAGLIIGAYLFGAAAISLLAPFIRPEGLGLGPEEIEVGRYAGGLEDPNEFAALLIPAIALSVGAIAALRGSAALRLGALFAAAACLVSFFLTSSRGGLVGLGIALVAGVLVAGRWRPAALIGALTLTTCTAIYFGGLAPQDVRDRIVGATRGETRVEESRLTIWEVGWRMVEDHPVRGVGVGNFENASINYVLEPGQTGRTDRVIDQPQAAHNTYLDILAELGIPGTIVFGAFASFCVWASGAAARAFRGLKDVPMEIMARALLAGQVGMLVAIFFFSAQSVNKVWLVLALGPGLLALSRASTDSDG